jgi:Holliday junction resolvase RusA-like endonuclease
MPPEVTVELAGPPRGKGRPRSRIVTSRTGQQFVSVYTDAETRNFETALAYAGRRAMAGKPPLDCPLRVVVTAVFGVPPSWSANKRSHAIRGLVRPMGTPDVDNICKGVDALNGIVFRDDSLIVDAEIGKWYGAKPFLRIEVWRWAPTLV